MNTPIRLLNIPGPCVLPATCLTASAPGAIRAGSTHPLNTLNLLSSFSEDVVPAVISGPGGSGQQLRTLSVRDPANLGAICHTLRAVVAEAHAIYRQMAEKDSDGYISLRLGGENTPWSLGEIGNESDSLPPLVYFSNYVTGREIELWGNRTASEFRVRTGWRGTSAALSRNVAVTDSDASVRGYRCEFHGMAGVQRMIGQNGPITPAGALQRIAAMVYTGATFNRDLLGPFLLQVDGGDPHEMDFDGDRFTVPVGLNLEAAQTMKISSTRQVTVEIDDQRTTSPAMVLIMGVGNEDETPSFIIRLSTPLDNPGFWSLDSALEERMLRSALSAVQLDFEPLRALQSAGTALPDHIAKIAGHITALDIEHRHPDDIENIREEWRAFVQNPTSYWAFLNLGIKLSNALYQIAIAARDAGVELPRPATWLANSSLTVLSKTDGLPPEWAARIRSHIEHEMFLRHEAESEAKRRKTPLEEFGFQSYLFSLEAMAEDEEAPDMHESLRRRADLQRLRQFVDKDVVVGAYRQCGGKFSPGAVAYIAPAVYYAYLIATDRYDDAAQVLHHAKIHRIMAAYALWRSDDALFPALYDEEPEEEQIILLPDSTFGLSAAKNIFKADHDGRDPFDVVRDEGEELAWIGWEALELTRLYELRVRPLMDSIDELGRENTTEFIEALDVDLARMAEVMRRLRPALAGYLLRNPTDRKPLPELLHDAIEACHTFLISAGMKDIADFFEAQDEEAKDLMKKHLGDIIDLTDRISR